MLQAANGEGGRSMRGKSNFYKHLVRIFWLSLIVGTVGIWYYVDRSIPDRVSVTEHDQEEFTFSLPWRATVYSESEEVALGNKSNIPAEQITINSREPFSMYAGKKGSYQLDLKLFGVIQFKNIQVDVVDTTRLIPCGSPVGIYLKSKGIMVIGTGRITGENGMEMEPAVGKLKSGDYIEAFNGQKLGTKEELAEAVSHFQGENVTLTVRRNGAETQVKIKPVKGTDGSSKLGVWVRDDTQGIGTMTYVDMNGCFGALGHGISDSDTGALVDIDGGELYETQILGIEKGQTGKPGVMSGVIYYGKGTKLGDVTENTTEGIYGTVNRHFLDSLQADAIPIGFRQDIQRGRAYIRSKVSGEVKDYEIEIQKVDYGSVQKNKGLVLKVVDEDLLNLTGGIVQGMSGSPIIQDGKLIGAVTHVFINDPTRGYGIFMENMLGH